MPIVSNTWSTTFQSGSNTRTSLVCFGKLRGQQRKLNSTPLVMPCVLSIPISQCIEWLLGTAYPMHWATVYFCGHCYGHLTSNIVESLNVWLLQARGLPIEGMLEAIREKLMGWFAERRDFATKHHDLRLVPEVHSYLCNEGSNGRGFKLQSTHQATGHGNTDQ